MTSLEQHFTRFLEHRQWLGNITGKTVSWYAQTFRLLLRLQPDLTEPAQLTKGSLQTVVVKMRARGLCPESCNTRITALNCFVGWLHTEGLLPTRFHLAKLRTEHRLVPTLTDEQLKRLIQFRPKSLHQWRPYVLTLALVDSGLRIEEALTLRPTDLDMNNLLFKVFGKGRKERLVPFSVELRKCLHQWHQKKEKSGWDGEWVSSRSCVSRMRTGRWMNLHAGAA
jgi:site-specific recombinase XerD